MVHDDDGDDDDDGGGKSIRTRLSLTETIAPVDSLWCFSILLFSGGASYHLYLCVIRTDNPLLLWKRKEMLNRPAAVE